MVHTARAAVALLLFALPLRAQPSLFPFTESFDLSTAIPPGWTASGFTISTTSSRSSPHCVSATGNLLARVLMTPVISFAGRMPERISFYERRTTTALRYRLALYAVTEDLTRTFPLARWDSAASANLYIQRTVDLAGQNLPGDPGVRFVFEILRDSTNSTGILRIDDLALTVQVGIDVFPVRLTVEPTLPVTGEGVTITAVVRNDGGQPASAGMSMLAWTSPDGSGSSLTMPLSVGAHDSTSARFRVSSLSPGVSQLTIASTCPGDENHSNDTIRAAVDVGYGPGSLVVNEIMFAPIREDEPEWIELFNPGPRTIDPGDLTVSDNSNSRVAVNRAGTDSLRPGSFVVLARSPDVGALYPSFAFVVVPFPSLNNTTPDAVVIRDRAGRTIDSVWYVPEGSLGAGNSLERRDWDLASALSSTWQASVDSLRATPGRVNSVQRPDIDLACVRLDVRRDPTIPEEAELIARIRNCGRRSGHNARVVFSYGPVALDPGEPPWPIGAVSIAELPPEDSIDVGVRWTDIPSGPARISAHVKSGGDLRPGNDTATTEVVSEYPTRSLIVNEVMFEPEPGQNEWVELFNPGPDPVDISGWTIEDLPTSSGSVVRSLVPRRPIIVHPGAFAVLAAESSVTSRYSRLEGSDIPVVAFGRGSGLGLNNDGDGVVLRDQTGATIDSVIVSAGWHVGGVASAGRSLERTWSHLSGLDAASWTSCTHVEGGTPGQANSVARAGRKPGMEVSLDPDPFSPDGDGFEDELVIRYRVDASSAFLTVRVFDVAGRELRELASASLAPGAGELRWDGKADGGRVVPIGAYIILVQAADTRTGTPHTARLVAVVAR